MKLPVLALPPFLPERPFLPRIPSWRIGGALLLLLQGLGAGAVSANESIRFRTYGVQEGLSGEPVYTTLQDHQGYLWIGTAEGLDRFDGHRFETFRYSEAVKSSLPEGRINALVEDPMGRLWVGTDTGIALYDREHKTFLRVSLPGSSTEAPSGNASLTDDPSVRALFIDRRQTLWIGTNLGLFRVAVRAALPRASDVRSGFEGLLPGAPGLADPRVHAFAEDAAGRLWIGTRAGLLRLASIGDRPHLDRFVHDSGDPGSLHDDEIYALLFDRRGDLWIGTWGTGGVGRLRSDQQGTTEPEFQRFVYPAGDPRGIPSGVVKSLFEDRDDNIWIGTQESGLCRLTTEERRREEPHFQCFTHAPLDPTSAPRAPFTAVTQDAQGILWFASQSGLSRHVPATAKIRLVHPRPEPEESAQSISVGNIWEARDGTVWVATGDGLERVREAGRHQESLRIERFRHDPDAPSSLSSNWIYTLLEDRHDQLWVGTVRGGLHRLVQNSQRPRFELFYEGDSGITNPTVFDLFEDSSGVLWVGTYQGLFHSRDSSTPKRPSFKRLELAAGALSSELVYSVQEDPAGRLWVGTDGGLDRLSADRREVDNGLIKPGLVVLQSVLGPEGKLWLVTDSSGLISVDPENESWQSWSTTLEALGNVTGASFDALGRLWVTTQYQMYRIQPRSGEIRRFGKGDGLRIVPFREGAFHRGHSGQFFVGGANGMAVFYPEELSQGPLLAPVVLRDLQIGNETVEVAADGPLPRSLETLDTLVLQPDDKTFTLEFAALAFHRQEALRYAHRLRGYSEDWIEFGSDRRRATFTNLSPGDYTFEVKARGDVGSWSPRMASLKVTVLPEWYETSWVRGLAVALGLGLPLLWIWFRFRRLDAHRRELQSLVDRWQMERRQRQQWQDLSMTAAQLAQQVRRPLELILHRAKTASLDGRTPAEDRELAEQILEPVHHATTKLEELVSFVVLPQPEAEQVDLGSLIDTTLFNLSEKIQGAGVSVRHGLHAIRVLADREMLAEILVQLIEDRLEHAVPGDSLRFTFENLGGTGRLTLEEISGQERGKEESMGRVGVVRESSSGIAAVARLAEHHEWTIDFETRDGTGTRIDLSGLRLA